MTADFGVLFDLAGSLAILGMLAVAYGTIRRSLPDRAMARMVLGILFGLVAILQMKTPFQPVEGLLIDMRNVPIVLAGAFLGLRGFLACVVLAAAARLQIGGVGASAGIAAMIIAGGMGGLWNAMTASRPRGARTMVVLALMGSAHLAAVVLLPSDQAIWFVANAAPILIGTNLLAIPLLGSLLERERDLLSVESRYEDEMQSVAEGPMPAGALAWAMAHSALAGALGGPVACVTVRVRNRGHIARLWGLDIDRATIEGLGVRVAATIPEGGVIGWAGHDILLLSVPDRPGDGVTNLCAAIRRMVVDAPASARGAGGVRLSLDLDVRRYAALPSMMDVMADMAPASRTGRRACRTKPPAAPRAIRPADAPHDLFATFDRLLEARLSAR